MWVMWIFLANQELEGQSLLRYNLVRCSQCQFVDNSMRLRSASTTPLRHKHLHKKSSGGTSHTYGQATRCTPQARQIVEVKNLGSSSTPSQLVLEKFREEIELETCPFCEVRKSMNKRVFLDFNFKVCGFLKLLCHCLFSFFMDLLLDCLKKQ